MDKNSVYAGTIQGLRDAPGSFTVGFFLGTKTSGIGIMSTNNPEYELIGGVFFFMNMLLDTAIFSCQNVVRFVKHPVLPEATTQERIIGESCRSIVSNSAFLAGYLIGAAIPLAADEYLSKNPSVPPLHLERSPNGLPNEQLPSQNKSLQQLLHHAVPSIDSRLV